MTRFLTKHEIDKKERQLKEDILLSASKYKYELKDAINIENHRINLDSAKKKAVIQGMNYDGFHQMVLGADLKGSNTQELMDLKPKGIIMNTVMTGKMLSKENDLMAGNFVINNEGDQISLENKFEKFNINLEEKFNMKEYLRNFKRAWKSYKTTEEKIAYLLSIELNFAEMINSDILESDFFLDLLSNVGSYILNHCKDSTLSENKQKIDKLSDHIESIINHKNFNGLKKFVGKKQKLNFIEINENKGDFFKNEESLLEKFNTFIDKLIL